MGEYLGGYNLTVRKKSIFFIKDQDEFSLFPNFVNELSPLFGGILGTTVVDGTMQILQSKLPNPLHNFCLPTVADPGQRNHQLKISVQMILRRDKLRDINTLFEDT